MNYFSSLKEVFSAKIYWAILVVAFLLLAIILSITSGFFLPAFMEFNQTAQPLNIAIVIAIAFLLALNLTIFIRNYEAKNQESNKTTFAGALAGLFMTSCPVCQPVWLVWLGFGGATAFLADVSIYFGIASVLFLLVGLHFSLKSVDANCEVPKNKLSSTERSEEEHPATAKGTRKGAGLWLGGE